MLGWRLEGGGGVSQTKTVPDCSGAFRLRCFATACVQIHGHVGSAPSVLSVANCGTCHFVSLWRKRRLQDPNHKNEK